MATDSAVAYRFDSFELYPAQRRLLADGAEIALGGRAFDLLVALVERGGELLSKDLLLDTVWRGLVVEENNLQAQISALRKVLGSGAIETVAGHGYRFIARTDRVESAAPPALPPRHDLPLQVTSFVGREQDMAHVAALLQQARLVTLTGSGGAGKTRLALHVGASLVGSFRDGVILVELAPVRDPRLVPQAVAAALGIKERKGTALADTLVAQVARRDLLVIVDNCEHVVQAAAEVCGRLLASCPSVRMLATSQEALRVPGESAYRVPSLPTPDAGGTASARAIAASPAVQLLVDRAAATGSPFELDDANAAEVSAICRRLDGIPLAIELAAARLRAISVSELRRRLDQRFQLLTGGARTALARHQTLRASIDWSYDLLGPPERALLGRLAVFAGGFTLAAAEQACSADDLAQSGVIDVLASLVEKSLVVTEERDGSVRYRLLEMVREYALDRLRESGAENDARRRHLACFIAMAEEAEPELVAAGQREWLGRLAREHDNVRAALAWSQEHDPASGLRLAAAIWRFWWMHGHLVEGYRWLCVLLAAVPQQALPQARLRGLDGAGLLAWGLADFAASGGFLEEQLALAREVGDRRAIARSSSLIAQGHWARGDDAAARPWYEDALAIYRDIDDRRGIAVALNGLANVTPQDGGGAVHAGRLLEEALTLFMCLGDAHGGAYALTGLARIAQRNREYTAARRHLAQCVQIQWDLGDRRGLAVSLEGLASVAASSGEIDRAVRIWGATERLRDEIGHPIWPSEWQRHEDLVTAARNAQRDDARFDLAWQEGRGMSLREAIDLAVAHGGG